MQISSDGKHLIDGVAFGRPYIGRSNARPSVRIPPRKRRRLTYDQDDDDGNTVAVDEPRLLLGEGRGSLEDPDGDSSDESFQPEEENGSEASTQLSAVSEGSASADLGTARALDRTAPSGSGMGGTRAQPTRRQSRRLMQHHGHGGETRDGEESSISQWHRQGLDDQGEPSAAMPPSTSVSRQSSTKVASPRQPRAKGRAKTSPPITLMPRLSSSRGSCISNKSVHFDKDQSGAQNEEPDVEGAFDCDDSGSSPDGSSDEFTARSSDSDTEDSSTSSEMAGTGTPGSARRSAPSRSAPSRSAPSRSAPSSASPSSAESSSAMSDDSSDSEELVASPSKTQVALDEPLSAAAPETRKTTVVQRPTKPPGTGSMATKKRNERRRRRRLLTKLETTARSEVQSTRDQESSVQRSETGQNSVMDGAPAKVEIPQKRKGKPEFEVQRQRLLTALANGGIEMPLEDSGKDVGAKASQPAGSKRSAAGAVVKIRESAGTEQPDGPGDQKAFEEPAKNSRFRPKLDLASSKRMLLHSLGLGGSQAKVRNQNSVVKRTDTCRDASGGRPSARHVIFGTNGQSEEKDESEGHLSSVSYENWQERMTLDAVECCEEGVTLSTPPFPFVQRWDPQQKFSGKTGKKGSKKRKRNQAQYYGDDDYSLDHADAAVAKDSQPHGHLPAEASVGGTPHQKDGESQGPLLVDPQTNHHEGQNDEGDIPAMPVDPNTCSVLGALDVRPGAIIGFKRLVMTPDWQPEVSGYQTAKVVKGVEGDFMEVTLAKRDRPTKEKHYDEHGERIYGKFEVADDDDPDQDDDGLLEISFSELIEPKLLQASPESLTEPGLQQCNTAAPDSSQKPVDYTEAHDEKDEVDPDVEMDAPAAGGDHIDDYVELDHGSDDFIPDYFASPLGSQPRQHADNHETGHPTVPDEPAPLHGDSPAIVMDIPNSPMFSGLGLDPLPQEGSARQERFRTPQASAEWSENDGDVPNHQQSSPAKAMSPRSTEQDDIRSPKSSRLEAASDEDRSQRRSAEARSKSPGHAIPRTVAAGVEPIESAETAVSHNDDTFRAQQKTPKPSEEPPADADELSSGCELPELDTIFTGTRASVSRVKRESTGSEVEPPRKNGAYTSLAVREVATNISAPSGLNPPSSTAPPPRTPKAASEVVDLTQLSDGITMLSDSARDENANGDYGDNEFGLPGGPGWIQKLRRGGRYSNATSSTGRGRKRPRNSMRLGSGTL